MKLAQTTATMKKFWPKGVRTSKIYYTFATSLLAERMALPFHVTGKSEAFE
ncbi:MAG: hypothetical protein Q4E55_02475 [Bacteroidales bacterium]|nr:hypothetical protein [Bacteroidales bacterium]